MRCSVFLEASRDAVAYIHEGMHVYAKSSCIRILDYADTAELQGLPRHDLVSPDDATKLKRLIRGTTKTRGKTTSENTTAPAPTVLK